MTHPPHARKPRATPAARRAREAVLDCCSPFRSPSASPPEGVTAEILVDEAIRLGLAPTLAGRIPAAWTQALPELATPLRRIRQGTVAQALMVDRVRTQVLALAKSAGVRLAITKGALTEPALHGASGLRVITDVDAICSAEDAVRLHARLLDAGYHRTGERRPYTIADFFEWTYLPPDRSPVLLDLHRHPCETAYFRVDVDAWLARTRDWPTPRGPIPGLCAEDMVLHVALHAASHGFELDLRTFHDVALLAAGPGVDLDAVVAQAGDVGALVPLWLTLKVLEDLFRWQEAGEVARRIPPARWREAYLRRTVPWTGGTLADWAGNNRARIILGIFPLLPSPRRAGAFLRTYVRRRVHEYLR